MQDGDIDTELKAGLSNSPFTKRGSGTGSRSGSIAPILVSGPPEPGGAEGDEGTVAMADDDYSARQLTWQSQSNENMKLLLSRFTPEQLLARYETYRRSTPNKQTARRRSLGGCWVLKGLRRRYHRASSTRSRVVLASWHSPWPTLTRPPPCGVPILCATDCSCWFH